MQYDRIAALVPAYKPDERLVTFVRALRETGFSRVVVVDDGGGAAYAPIFEAIEGEAEVLRHETNRGKGAALKTGLCHLLKTPGWSAVTADADGQHAPKDCARVADALIASPDALILGVRDKRQMPVRSKLGNNLTCFMFGITSGMWVSDTQTGLRGLPAGELERFSQLDGDRYEYELNMLLDVRQRRRPFVEVKIETIYIDDNASSHFRPLQDGLRIYGLMFRQALAFAISSLLSSGVDYGLFVLIHLVYPDVIAVATYGARAISSLVNYFVNRELVFKCHDRTTIIRYYILVVVVATGSYLITGGLSGLGMSALAAKPIADAVMFMASYTLQQKIVFRKRK